jgi:hypothetical protein
VTLCIESCAFSVPKRGNLPEENEDAFAREDVAGVFAIADGATEGAFSRVWARQLVGQFREKPLGSRVLSAIDWEEWLPRFAAPLPASESPPWFWDRAVERGSFATILGLSFTLPESKVFAAAWQAIAVGDSCLFQVKPDQLLLSFPLDHTHDFGAAPFLVGTTGNTGALLIDKARGTQGRLAVDESLVLVTDALAAWVLADAKESGQRAARLSRISNDDEFVAFVESLRSADQIKNDDCTLVVIGLKDESQDENQ